MPTKDYVPNGDGLKLTWADNLKAKLPNYAATFGLQPADVTFVQGLCTDIHTSINSNNAAQTTARQLRLAKDATVSGNIKQIRAIVQLWKNNPNYTLAIGSDLGIVGSEDNFDEATYKTVLTTELHPGRVTIKFTKKGVDGVNVYSRLKGQATWVKLAFDSYSPYEDNRPLATPNVPEHREYMAIGVLYDHEIGLQSDIVEVVYGG